MASPSAAASERPREFICTARCRVCSVRMRVLTGPLVRLRSEFKTRHAVRVLARKKLKEGGGGVDRIYLLPKYFAMHIWLNISFSEHKERRGERKKGGGIKKKQGNSPLLSCFS